MLSGSRSSLTFDPDAVVLGADPPRLDCCDLLSEIKGSDQTHRRIGDEFIGAKPDNPPTDDDLSKATQQGITGGHRDSPEVGPVSRDCGLLAKKKTRRIKLTGSFTGRGMSKS
jgi:hypothetical protein